MSAGPDLSRLLRPRSIAVAGGAAAAEVIRQAERIGFAGPIWPVHPEKREVAGRTAFRSIAELPAAPDAMFLGVNRQASIPLMADLAARGGGGAVAYAAGFAETGAEGAALQRALVRAAAGMPFLGPNCYGFVNYLDRALLWPDQHGGRPVGRGVAIVTQSGNIGQNLTMQRRGLPLAAVVTLGNQAATGLSAVLATLAADERITAIGLHVEAFDDPAAFARAAGAARARGLPVVVLKTGASEEGARITVSHTASLGGRDAAVDAFLARCGSVRVPSLPALLETLKLLHVRGPLTGGDIRSMSCSGGEAALVADLAARRRLRLARFTAPERARVAATLPDRVAVGNPLDYQTFHWGKPAPLAATFGAVLSAPADMTLLVLDYPREDRCTGAEWLIAEQALVAAARATGAAAGIVSTLPETMPEARAEALIEAGIVPFQDLGDALLAIETAAEAGRLARQEPVSFPSLPPLSGTPRGLDEWQAKQALAAAGLAVPDGRLVRTPAEAADAAEALGFPVAVKAAGAALAHKSERGAVRLGLGDRAAVAAAATALRPLGEALLVERMVEGAVAEMIVGVERDPQLGLVLMVGSGGVLAELVGDRAVLLLPATDAEIRAALGGLKAARLLAGHRGRPPGDLDATLAAVLAIQRYAVAEAGRLLELEANPLIVRPPGLGAVAADALIRFMEEPR